MHLKSLSLALAACLFAIGEDDRDFIDTPDHMASGENESILTDDDSAA